MSNEVVEQTLEAALAAGCEKVDLFFMVGLSGQTPALAMETIPYCRHLVERFGADRRLQFYVAPLGPFLDPGSRAYEQPETLGYHRLLTTLAEHRAALLGPTWQDMLSYETDWMTREQIVATTYSVGRGLNDLKHECGLIDRATHDTVDAHLSSAVRTLAEVALLTNVPEPERRRRLQLLKSASEVANSSSLVGEDELKWKTPRGIRLSIGLCRHIAAALPRELLHGIDRYRGSYDQAVAAPELLPTRPVLLGIPVLGRPHAPAVGAGRPSGTGPPALFTPT